MSSPWKAGSCACKASTSRDLVRSSSHTFRIASSALCSSGEVKPATQRMRLGMVSVSKGVASKVTSGKDQILWHRIKSDVGWEIPYARKVIRGWVVNEVGVGGGAIVAAGSLSPVDAAISWTAFLKRPASSWCFVFCSLPLYPKNLTKNFVAFRSHHALTVPDGRPCRYSPGIPLYVVGKLPSMRRVKRVSEWVDELRDTISSVDSATADRVWNRSDEWCSVYGVGVSVFTVGFMGA